MTRYHDSTAGRQLLLAERRQSCTRCERTWWNWPRVDSMFTADPFAKICDLCLAKPRQLERRRLLQVEAGKRAQASLADPVKRRESQRRREDAELVRLQDHDEAMIGVYGDRYVPQAPAYAERIACAPGEPENDMEIEFEDERDDNLGVDEDGNEGDF